VKKKRAEYFYGPVYSRRLGFSLGVDLLQKKICSYGCVYCQQGATAHTTLQRFNCVDITELKKQLNVILAQKPHIDYITVSGSGEPTLHQGLDKLLKAINDVTKHKYSICVITNGSLLSDAKVRQELRGADMVMPSLDGYDEKSFQMIDKPDKHLSFAQTVAGLVDFRKEYQGELWLEIMLVKGINDTQKAFLRFKELVAMIKPDKVQINLPVRPAPHTKKNLMPAMKAVNSFHKILGAVSAVVVAKPVKSKKHFLDDCTQIVTTTLKRRPQTIDDLANGLQIDYPSLKRCLSILLKTGKINENKKGDKTYFVFA